jgi:hypothetical protein
MKPLLTLTFALALTACSEPPPVKTLAEAKANPGKPQVSTEEMDLAIDLGRARNGGGAQPTDTPEMNPAELDALLYKIAMDPEAAALYAHEATPATPDPAPTGMLPITQ